MSWLPGAVLRVVRRIAWHWPGRARYSASPEPAAPAVLHGYVEGPHGRIYVDPQDQRGQALVAAGGDFNPATMSMWRALIAERPWTHIIDVGANYGEMLIAIPRNCGAAVMAVEPNPYLLPYLRRTILESGLRADVVEAVLSDRPGRIALNIDREWSGMSSVLDGESAALRRRIEVREVEAETLGRLLAGKSGVRLLVKIDVERHEVAVLLGLGPMLSTLEDFAALIEMSHLGADDLAWIVSQFHVSLWSPQEGRLVTVTATDGAALRALLDGGQYYALDAVLRRRTDLSPA